MTNVPTDLLRTLVAVVDLRSFTKAAVSRGLTQPAVSAQIKRLQILLGAEVFDRSVQGISLTPHGETVVSCARRLLSINDQIVRLSAAGPRPELVIRVGTSSDYITSILPVALAHFRERRPDVRFIVRTDYYESLLRELRGGGLDVLVGLSTSPEPDALHHWQEEMVWVRGGSLRIDHERPVPLVTYGEPCTYHRLATSTLKLAGMQWEDVFTGPSVASLGNAVSLGLGVMAVTRRVATAVGLTVWEDAPLPRLPDLHCGVFVREGTARAAYEQLGEEIAATLRGSAYRAPKLIAAGDLPRKASPAA